MHYRRSWAFPRIWIWSWKRWNWGLIKLHVGRGLSSSYPLDVVWTQTATVLRSVTSRRWFMMTSSNGNIFRVTGPLCGEFTGPGEFPAQRPVTRSFDVFFDLRLNKRLSKQSWDWWFETPAWSLWRHRNVLELIKSRYFRHCYKGDKNWTSLQYRNRVIARTQREHETTFKQI